MWPTQGSTTRRERLNFRCLPWSTKSTVFLFLPDYIEVRELSFLHNYYIILFHLIITILECNMTQKLFLVLSMYNLLRNFDDMNLLIIIYIRLYIFFSSFSPTSSYFMSKITVFFFNINLFK